MRYERIIYYMVAYVSFVFAGVFDNATIYVSGSMGTPYIKGNIELEDDYKYSIGLRKIALFPYQSSKKFYKGEESALSDNALFGASDGLEYLISASSVKNRGHEFIDQEYWLKWSKNSLIPISII